MLTNNDSQIGPLTYGRSSWRPWRLSIESHGGDDGHPYNALIAYAFGWVFRLYLPRIIQPKRTKVEAKSWDAETVRRLGRDWYWDVEAREYGVCLSEGHLTVYYGIQPGDSTKDQYWSCFLPWTQWRFIRFSLYQPDGTHFFTQIESDRRKQKVSGLDYYKPQHEAQEKVGKIAFKFLDFDGEEITATTHVEEREWRFGTGWCSWLGVFRKPKISRSLSINFSAEVGPEKGSWKGGTTGHGIDMLPGETPEQAFRRYCEKKHRSKSGGYGLTFVGLVSQ